jgi:MFS family permease
MASRLDLRATRNGGQPRVPARNAEDRWRDLRPAATLADAMTTPTPPSHRPRRPRLPAVLREEPQYRLLFSGQFLSIIGDRVTSVVLPFAVLAVGGDVGDVAVVSAAQFIPFALLALPAGVWADRYDRKRILITSDVVRFLCQAVAGTLLLTDRAGVVHLAVLAALYGGADAFFAPAFTGLLPGTVAPVNLQPANALRGLSYSTGSIAGPVIAGLLVVWVGTGGALLFDAGTFLVSVACLVPLRPRVVQRVLADEDPQASTEHFLASLRAGWVEVRSRSWVLGFLGGMASYHVVVLPAIFVLGPVLVAEELGGAQDWAIITAGFGLGSVLGNLLLLRWRPRWALRVAALMLTGASCQAAFIGSGLGVWAIAGLEVLAGICVTGCFTLWETSLQEHVPDHALSRVSSYDYLTSAGLIPLGNLLAGAVSSAVGVEPSLFAMSALGVTASLLVLALPAVRHLPRAVPVQQ